MRWVGVTVLNLSFIKISGFETRLTSFDSVQKVSAAPTHFSIRKEKKMSENEDEHKQKKIKAEPKTHEIVLDLHKTKEAYERAKKTADDKLARLASDLVSDIKINDETSPVNFSVTIERNTSYEDFGDSFRLSIKFRMIHEALQTKEYDVRHGVSRVSCWKKTVSVGLCVKNDNLAPARRWPSSPYCDKFAAAVANRLTVDMYGDLWCLLSSLGDKPVLCCEWMRSR